MPATHQVIRRRALRLVQDADHPLYVFTLTAEELAAVANVSRDDAGKLIGYQRPEVKRHVQDIVNHLNGDRVIFPNPIILALSSRVTFTRSRGPEVDDGLGAAGILEIPVPRDGATKPAWIVDGQQRAVALAKSRRKRLPAPVNGFVADEVALQRDQFLRVNNTRPLPSGLITDRFDGFAYKDGEAGLAKLIAVFVTVPEKYAGLTTRTHKGMVRVVL